MSEKVDWETEIRIEEILMKEAFLEKLLPRVREETIEECAQAIEDYFDHIGFAEGAAAYIRALKDKP